MISKKLQRARDFEKKYIPYVAEELPKFHVTGGIGWINDPNGFAPYHGEYHLFYQYHPYDVKRGPMHWGHVKTKDFVRWERLPAALAPDADYDRDGCFSGGAVEMPDGRHLLMYTGVRNVRRKNGRNSFRRTSKAGAEGNDSPGGRFRSGCDGRHRCRTPAEVQPSETMTNPMRTSAMPESLTGLRFSLRMKIPARTPSGRLNCRKA